MSSAKETVRKVGQLPQSTLSLSRHEGRPRSLEISEQHVERHDRRATPSYCTEEGETQEPSTCTWHAWPQCSVCAGHRANEMSPTHILFKALCLLPTAERQHAAACKHCASSVLPHWRCAPFMMYAQLLLQSTSGNCKTTRAWRTKRRVRSDEVNAFVQSERGRKDGLCHCCCVVGVFRRLQLSSRVGPSSFLKLRGNGLVGFLEKVLEHRVQPCCRRTSIVVPRASAMSTPLFCGYSRLANSLAFQGTSPSLRLRSWNSELHTWIAPSKFGFGHQDCRSARWGQGVAKTCEPRPS